MSAEKSSQSFSIRGKQSSGQTSGQAKRDRQAPPPTQQRSGGDAKAPLTPTDVIELISQLEAVFQSSGLPEVHAIKAIRQLEAAKAEAQSAEPNKAFAANSLQRAAKVLKEASVTVDAGNSLWEKVQPIVSKLSPWLGVGASFFA